MFHPPRQINGHHEIVARISKNECMFAIAASFVYLLAPL